MQSRFRIEEAALQSACPTVFCIYDAGEIPGGRATRNEDGESRGIGENLRYRVSLPID